MTPQTYDQHYWDTVDLFLIIEREHEVGRRYNWRALERAEREIGGRHDQDIQDPCMNFEELI